MSRFTKKQLSDAAVAQLTFGAEFEAHFKFHDVCKHELSKEDKFQKLSEELTRVSGIKVRHLTLVDKNERRSSEADYQAWSLVADSSILIDENAGPGWFGIELRSRVLHAHSKADLSEIPRVFEALKLLGQVTVGKDTGFHVHVGFEFRSFSLRTLQNLAAIASSFDAPLATIHPQDRQLNEQCLQYSFIPGHTSPSIDDSLGGDDFNHFIGSHRAVTCLHSPSWGALSQFVRAEDKGMTINFRPAFSSLRTVEFRSHQSTFDINRVKAWLSLCCGLVLYSRLATDAQLVDLFALLRFESLPVAHLLRAMGLDEAADFYKESRLYELAERFVLPAPCAAGYSLIVATLQCRDEIFTTLERRWWLDGRLKIEEEYIEENSHPESCYPEIWGPACNDPDIYLRWVPFNESPFTMSKQKMDDIIDDFAQLRKGYAELLGLDDVHLRHIITQKHSENRLALRNGEPLPHDIPDEPEGYLWRKLTPDGFLLEYPGDWGSWPTPATILGEGYFEE